MKKNNTATVMIVEDDDVIRETLGRLISFEGYSLLQASNGQEALEILKTQTPDVILLDLMMPVMDGWQFREQQMINSVIANIPTVLLSASADIKSKAKNLGMSEYFQKPIDIGMLLDRLELLCGNQKMSALG